METKFYYKGLCSAPILVTRTSTTPWNPPPVGEDGDLKELRILGNHPIRQICESDLSSKVHALLQSMAVNWTSIDLLRIGIYGVYGAPVILWLGVKPGSLSGEDGVVVTFKCRELLVEYEITNVDVKIRESCVFLSSSRPLPASGCTLDPTVDVHEYSTTALGLPICAQSTPWAEGTGGFFIVEGGNIERLLLVTARHVVFPPDRHDNKHFELEKDTQDGYKVTLLGDVEFHTYLKSIARTIVNKADLVKELLDRIYKNEMDIDLAANEERATVQAKLEKARKALDELNAFYWDVSTRGATAESRVVGRVILSPPIGVCREGFTEDWAVSEINPAQVNASNFAGTTIDLGASLSQFNHMMNAQDALSSGKRFLKPKGTISNAEMRNPTALDQNGDSCLMVFNHGSSSGLTVGRANDICSYARSYDDDDGCAEFSKEWAILPFDSKSGAFAAKRDSGSVIVDGRGRIGGLITRGAGARSEDPKDLTYATPVSFLLRRLEEHGVREPSVNLVLAF